MFLNRQEKQAILKLWNQEYPKNLKYSKMEDFDSYLLNLENPQHVLVKDDQNKIWGWYVEFKREHEVWFAMILDSSIQGKGVGSQILEKVKNYHTVLNGWVIDQDNCLKNDGAHYRSPLGFYLKNNFKVITETRLELPKISAVKIVWMAN
jgi:GNAT superfamily N-acetyltransferase